MRDKQIRLLPEGLLVLNETAAAIVALCDGRRTVADIAADLGTQDQRPVDQDVLSLLNRLMGKQLLEAAAEDDR